MTMYRAEVFVADTRPEPERNKSGVRKIPVENRHHTVWHTIKAVWNMVRQFSPDTRRLLRGMEIRPVGEPAPPPEDAGGPSEPESESGDNSDVEETEDV